MFFLQAQELGLQYDYTNDRATYAFIRKVMALPFLPADEIPDMYARLEGIPESRKLQDSMQYVNLDHERNTATVIMEYLHEVYQDEQ